MKRFFYFTILFLFILSGVLAANEFKIGVVTSLTGLFGKDGNLVKDAYNYWADTVNSAGGIKIDDKSFKVKLIFYDDTSSPEVGAKMVDRLINKDKVDLLLGGFGSSQVFAESAVAEKYGYPMISGAASSNKLFERGFKTYFSTLGKATNEVKGAVSSFANIKNKPKTAAIVGADILFTSLACEGFKKYCEDNGINIIHFELFPLKLDDYNSMLLKVKEKNPDILFVGSHMLVAMKTIKALKEIKYMPKGVAFSYGPTVPEFIKELKKDAEYVVAASEWSPELPYKGKILGSAKEFADGYLKKYGRIPDYVEAASAAGAVVQQFAIESLKLKPPIKDKDRAQIIKWLHENEVDTFYGSIKFDKDGANLKHSALAVQVQNGTLKVIYPENFKESAIVYPSTGWENR